MLGVGRCTPERPGNVCLGRPSLIPASAVLEQLSDSFHDSGIITEPLLKDSRKGVGS